MSANYGTTSFRAHDLMSTDRVEQYIEEHSRKDESGVFVFDYAAATIAIRGLSSALQHGQSRYNRVCMQATRTLDAQKLYFKTKRQDHLIAAKQEEEALRAMLTPKQMQMKI